MTEKPVPTQSVIVIGAGPAGLAAGTAFAQTGKNVTVIERNDSAGSKLLLSGQGQCNVTHTGSVDEFLQHYGSMKQSRFIKPALCNFDNQSAMQFFEQSGVPLWIRDDGKVFPKSLKAKDILNALLQKLKEAGGKLVTNTFVRRGEKTGSTQKDCIFTLETNSGIFSSDILVIATGGKSYPVTGSDGNGYRLAEMFGHRIIPPKPALTAVTVRDYPFADSAGTVLADVPVEVLRNGKPLAKNTGSVLLTHTGLSGPCILNISRFIESGDVLQVQLISDRLPPDLYTGRKTLKNVLQTLGFSETFLQQLLRVLDIPPMQPAAETNRSMRQQLESALLRFPFAVKMTGNWNESAATAGGVDINEVKRQTMESRLVSGLYFCGEVLDVDGGSGGYNIQFALSSGILCAKHYALR
ncbi:MAG: aminoacetone oxidase family FAD-binding enzyme [Planctomycetaceae bacterium]|jgi:predicted Rossmann fold flavoprotein|nr:aminoacetone oxidase family FAD-binding enzyme [Planctomycetaceae bacterium]